MADELRAGRWHVVWEPDAAEPTVRDGTGELIATVHGGDVALKRAMVIMVAPEVMDSLEGAAMVLRAIAEDDPGPAGDAAREYLPVLEGRLAMVREIVGSAVPSPPPAGPSSNPGRPERRHSPTAPGG